MKYEEKESSPWECSQWRGHAIIMKNGRWIYADTREPSAGNRRPCGHCGRKDTPEGHDGCLGTLPNVINACCGHGSPKEAYVQFKDGRELRGAAARCCFWHLWSTPTEN